MKKLGAFKANTCCQVRLRSSTVFVGKPWPLLASTVKSLHQDKTTFQTAHASSSARLANRGCGIDLTNKETCANASLFGFCSCCRASRLTTDSTRGLGSWEAKLVGSRRAYRWLCSRQLRRCRGDIPRIARWACGHHMRSRSPLRAPQFAGGSLASTHPWCNHLGCQHQV